MWASILAAYQIGKGILNQQEQERSSRLAFQNELRQGLNRALKRNEQLQELLANLSTATAANYVNPNSGSALAVRRKLTNKVERDHELDFENLRYKAKLLENKIKHSRRNMLFSSLFGGAALAESLNFGGGSTNQNSGSQSTTNYYA